jgi:aspartate-semialdehyde dehydrogenase
VVALKPLHDFAKIKRVVVATYQSVSGAGKEGIDELWNQTKAHLRPDRRGSTPSKFSKQIAFNVIPHIDVFMEDGLDQGRVEDGGRDQKDSRSRRSSSRPPACASRCSWDIQRGGQSSSSRISSISADEAQRHPARGPRHHAGHRQAGIRRLRHADRKSVGEYDTYISRVRQDSTIENGLNLWCVSDNLRKGAALNAVQIAELLGSKVLKKG